METSFKFLINKPLSVNVKRGKKIDGLIKAGLGQEVVWILKNVTSKIPFI